MPYSVFVKHRLGFYALLWSASVIELALTGWRIHHTKTVSHFYDPIVAELLVTAALTILWIPVAGVVNARKSKELAPGSSYSLLNIEAVGNFVLWVMWLVGGAIVTHKFPTKAVAGTGSAGHILITLVAFSWISFGLLTFASVFIAMHGAALYGGAEASHSPLREKRDSA